LKKLLVIGLDSTPHELIFDEMVDELPTFRKLMQNGIYGRLKSSIPAITIPAWMTMCTGKNPGRLGFYGFRNRRENSYNDIFIANAKAVNEPTVWQILSEAGKTVIVLGVPQTYPPKPVNGLLVSSFLTPDTDCEYTYPAELKNEIKDVVGEYLLDAEQFRTEDKDRLLKEIYEMTEKRFRLWRHFNKTREWDFSMMVCMGTDRIQHGFWKFHDPKHIKYQPGNKYENSIRDYYRYLDEEISRTLDEIDDNTAVLVVSDHGARRMDGSVCVNDWLIRESYLKLKTPPTEITRIKNLEVDWPETTAWGWGGYVCRMFLNVKGREPEGCIEPGDYEKVQNELKEKLENLPDHTGRKMATIAHRRQDIYTGPYMERMPDLVVCFDDLYWRSSEDVGHDDIYSFETEIGPDDAMHAQHGMFILANAGDKRGRIEGADLIDGAQNILEIMGTPIPDDMEGRLWET
jgi:predicted AlkP superfamily phosphohydrolase/phosphomutase